MKYLVHKDFTESLSKLANKGFNYSGPYNQALHPYLKACENQPEKEVFKGLKVNNKGEKRIKHAIKFDLVSEHEFDWLAKTSIQIYNIMSAKAKSAGFILADLKLEFGKHENELFLSDSIRISIYVLRCVCPSSKIPHLYKAEIFKPKFERSDNTQLLNHID